MTSMHDEVKLIEAGKERNLTKSCFASNMKHECFHHQVASTWDVSKKWIAETLEQKKLVNDG